MQTVIQPVLYPDRRLVPRFIPLYFDKDISTGIPTLTPEGRKAVEEELAESSPYCIEGYDEPAGKLKGETVAEPVVGS